MYIVALFSCFVNRLDIFLAIFKNFPFAELYAICDMDDKRLENAAKAHPTAKLFKDYNDVLADVNIDVIHICTPHHLHCEMVEKALAAGKNVLLEKPVCISMDEFERMKKAEEKSSAVLGIVFQNRYNLTTKKYSKSCLI